MNMGRLAVAEIAALSRLTSAHGRPINLIA